MKPKLRFSIFSRDQYTCQYCGRRPPEVKLHVDHVISRNDGGSDHPSNLVTACQDCNLGKSSTSLLVEELQPITPPTFRRLALPPIVCSGPPEIPAWLPAALSAAHWRAVEEEWQRLTEEEAGEHCYWEHDNNELPCLTFTEATA